VRVISCGSALLIPGTAPRILHTSTGTQFLDTKSRPGCHMNVVESPRT
jgi:hypothetical protein